MANNYTLMSEALYIERSQVEKADAVITRVCAELEEGDDGYCGVDVSIEGRGTDDPFVWFRGEESVHLDHVEILATELLEELEINTPFIVTWADTCDKPRISEFSGGGMRITRGKDIVYFVGGTANNTWEARMVTSVEIQDPDTGNMVDVAILKDPNGGLWGVDASYLANTVSPVFCPFNGMLVNDENL